MKRSAGRRGTIICICKYDKGFRVSQQNQWRFVEGHGWGSSLCLTVSEIDRKVIDVAKVFRRTSTRDLSALICPSYEWVHCNLECGTTQSSKPCTLDGKMASRVQALETRLLLRWKRWFRS